MCRQDGPADFEPLQVDKYAMSVYDIDVRMLSKEICHANERARQICVVTIDVAHDVAIDALEIQD